jgi:homoaconitase/3-isopropylmalate dehydratase large subunit
MSISFHARTHCDKIWDAYGVRQSAGGPALIHIDQHFIHDANLPWAFSGLNRTTLKVHRQDLRFDMMDLTFLTTDRMLPMVGNKAIANAQFNASSRNSSESVIALLTYPFLMEK